LMTDDARQVGAYSRVGKKDAAVIVFNRSDTEQKVSLNVPLSVQAHARTGIIDALSGTRYRVTERPVIITLKSKSAAVLIAKSNSNLSPAPLASNYASVNGDSAQRRANLSQEPQKTK
jgi:hypothetical protein